MTRRPASRRPPKLPDPHHETVEGSAPAPPRVPAPRELLKRNRVSGCAHPRLGRSEVREIARRVVVDDPARTHGLDLGHPDVEDLYAALSRHWGCTLDDARARLDVDLTITRLDDALMQIRDAAAAGGRLIFASSRPAALLAFQLTLAREAEQSGGRVLREREVNRVRAAGRPDRALWWVEGVAVVTDGSGMLAHDDPGVWAEIDFALGRAELVVADGALAGGALAAGFEVVALADVDSMVLGLAADRGLPVTVVPMVCSRPAWCYEPLRDLVSHATRSTSAAL